MSYIAIAMVIVALIFAPESRGCMKRDTCGLESIRECQTWCGKDGVQSFEQPAVIVCRKPLSRCQCMR
jgi:hypothetical protein